MAMTLKQFRKHLDKRHKQMGVQDSYEALAIAHNWREVFGTDLPGDYYHPRDYHILQEAMTNLLVTHKSERQTEDKGDISEVFN